MTHRACSIRTSDVGPIDSELNPIQPFERTRNLHEPKEITCVLRWTYSSSLQPNNIWGALGSRGFVVSTRQIMDQST